MIMIRSITLIVGMLLSHNMLYTTPISIKGCVDLVIFSRNRPMQLTATLESIEKHITGLKTITVLCHTDNNDFLRGYNNVHKDFPYVTFVMQERNNRQAHFKRQLLELVEALHAPYFMFAVDDIIVTDKVDLHHCCKLLQETAAYSCHLRVGKDITRTSRNLPMPQPPFHPIKGGMYAWFIHEAGGFDSYFGYPYSVDMTIFPRDLVVQYTRRSQCVSPNTFEGYWNWSTPRLPQKTRGLCYPTSRMVNIELNLVQEGWNPSLPCRYSPEKLLEMYHEGFRIDVDSLFQIPHNACHADLPVTWRKK
jgi:hypothetical protein